MCRGGGGGGIQMVWSEWTGYVAKEVEGDVLPAAVHPYTALLGHQSKPHQGSTLKKLGTGPTGPVGLKLTGPKNIFTGPPSKSCNLSLLQQNQRLISCVILLTCLTIY